MVTIADCIKFFGEVCIGDMPVCFTVITRTYRPSDAGDNHGIYNKMD